MLTYKDITITRTDTTNGSYSQKKKKWIPYKKPLVETKVICKDQDAYDLGDLYNIIKFHTELNEGADNLEIKFNTKIEY